MAVTRLDITAREPLLGGKPFGATGAYEMLCGTVTFAVNPTHPRHHDITDLDKAPRTAAGKVEWWADCTILQPVNPARGNRRLFFEVVNRGRIRAFRMFDGVAETPNLTREEHLGNGFLLQQGYTLAWCGWQWDVMRVEGMLGTGVPQATVGDTPVSGHMLCQWWPNATTPTLRMHGATIPFAPTPSVREQSNDVRPSIAERYPSREVYRELVSKATEALIAEGYLLPADLDEIVQRAIWRYNLCTAQS